MDAPVSPAGLPAISISAAREDTEEIASLPAMSVQDDGTDVVAIGPREGGQALPLTAEALAVMGLNDPRTNAQAPCQSGHRLQVPLMLSRPWRDRPNSSTRPNVHPASFTTQQTIIRTTC